MYRRLYDFLEQDNVLYSHQFGYRANHSINHALISLTESVKHTLDNKRFVCGICIDLKKTFDTFFTCIIQSYKKNLSTMVSEEWPYLGLDLILATGNSMFL